MFTLYLSETVTVRPSLVQSELESFLMPLIMPTGNLITIPIACIAYSDALEYHLRFHISVILNNLGNT